MEALDHELENAAGVEVLEVWRDGSRSGHTQKVLNPIGFPADPLCASRSRPLRPPHAVSLAFCK